MKIVDWIGFVGVFLILLAFFLQTINRINPKSMIYILLNLTGAALACIASILLKYIPFIILEGAWTLVSLSLLVRTLKTTQDVR